MLPVTMVGVGVGGGRRVAVLVAVGRDVGVWVGGGVGVAVAVAVGGGVGGEVAVSVGVGVGVSVGRRMGVAVALIVLVALTVTVAAGDGGSVGAAVIFTRGAWAVAKGVNTGGWGWVARLPNAGNARSDRGQPIDANPARKPVVCGCLLGFFRWRRATSVDDQRLFRGCMLLATHAADQRIDPQRTRLGLTNAPPAQQPDIDCQQHQHGAPAKRDPANRHPVVTHLGKRDIPPLLQSVNDRLNAMVEQEQGEQRPDAGNN